MTCPYCNNETQLSEWIIIKVKCISSSCRESSGRECPNCHRAVSHVYLDGMKEWRESEFYIS